LREDNATEQSGGDDCESAQEAAGQVPTDDTSISLTPA
jgi:hypothetical protein